LARVFKVVSRSFSKIGKTIVIISAKIALEKPNKFFKWLSVSWFSFFTNKSYTNLCFLTANFFGLSNESTAKDLLRIVKTKKTELLFIALFLRLLKTGGRAAVIVPDGVLFGSSTAHKSLRKMLVED